MKIYRLGSIASDLSFCGFGAHRVLGTYNNLDIVEETSPTNTDIGYRPGYPPKEGSQKRRPFEMNPPLVIDVYI
ncbi:MAG: hypothetical protein ABIF08_03340 [Nanoarchaeota archaeon]